MRTRDRDDWAFSLLAREAARNTLRLRARLFPLVALATVLGSVTTCMLAWSWLQFEGRLADLAQQGASVVTILAADPGGQVHIDRASCEGLAHLEGVASAGVLEPGASLDIAQLGPKVPTIGVSRGQYPELAGIDAVIGSALAAQAELGPPGTRLHLATLDGQVIDAMVAEPRAEGLGSGYALAFLAPVTQTETTTCLVELDALVSPTETLTVLPAAIVARGDAITAVPQLRQPLSVAELYRSRLERWLPLALGVVGGLAAALVTRLRVSELAVYRLAGTSARSLGAIVTLEQLIATGFWASSASLTAAVLARVLPWSGLVSLDPKLWVAWSLSGALAWLVCSNALTWPLLRRRPTDMAKDR